MKIKTQVLIWAVITAGLLICLQTRFVSAEPDAAKGSKTGVVNIQKIFKESRKVVKYREEVMAQRNKIDAELDKLAKEIELEKAGLKTLKADSNDYMNQVKEILTKQANAQAQEKFYDQQMSLKEQQMVEKIYKQILAQVQKVAQQKALDIVLTKDEPDFPAMSLNDATMIVRTSKVLYSGGCVDITNDVLANLDKEQ